MAIYFLDGNGPLPPSPESRPALLTTPRPIGYTCGMTPTLEPVPEEEVRLREQAARAAFVQRLLAEGLIPAVPTGRPGPPPRPVPVQGRPISETLVEERC